MDHLTDLGVAVALALVILVKRTTGSLDSGMAAAFGKGGA